MAFSVFISPVSDFHKSLTLSNISQSLFNIGIIPNLITQDIFGPESISFWLIVFHVIGKPTRLFIKRIIHYNDRLFFSFSLKKFMFKIRKCINITQVIIWSRCWNYIPFTCTGSFRVLFIGGTLTTNLAIVASTYTPCRSRRCFITNNKNDSWRYINLLIKLLL